MPFKDIDCTKCLTRPSSCFKLLSEDELRLINKSKIITLYKKGQNIFYEGRMPSGLYCLKSGKVKIAKTGLDGKEQIVRFVIPGGLLGIRAFIADRNYMANSTALEDSVVCFFDKQTFNKITEKNPDISRCLLATLSKLLGEAEERITSLAQKPVRERLAETLLLLNTVYKTKGQWDINPIIRLSREDLANIVGTATETIIRLLKNFKDEELISIDGRNILLGDIEGLKRIAYFGD